MDKSDLFDTEKLLADVNTDECEFSVEEIIAEIKNEKSNTEKLPKENFESEDFVAPKKEKSKVSEKEILKTWAKTDSQIKEYYKTLDKRGGSRQGSGRKVGSKNTTPKAERTERFTNAITKEEKEYLGICLEWYRNIKQYNPELLDKILAEYRQYGTFLYTKPLDGKLRTINKE